ncbi:response regulator [Desulfosporosinus sp.]|uniref:ANTAR domain-containing response regulator n=1 Tax=Desulfosporosinus sp. TaxID=157907 RepID=UPI00232091A1|nr:response regulator [Desulfosporosinus sp.]MCO5387344.1 response regulator [Desulfosporosinus sp.]MDA8222297.1 response regulator [Desulfitobacterium hafniense]
MKQLRVILADDEPITLLDIKEILIEEGYKVIGECEDGVSAVNLAKILKPDLVILDIKMPVMNGIDAAKILSQERIAPVLLLTAYSSNEFIEQAGAAGVLAYLIKPVTKNCLIAACKIALKRAQEFNVLRDENLSLQDALETRKLIERAKGILEKEYLLSEENAFKKIRQISMKQNKSMKDVAKAIILSLS